MASSRLTLRSWPMKRAIRATSPIASEPPILVLMPCAKLKASWASSKGPRKPCCKMRIHPPRRPRPRYCQGPVDSKARRREMPNSGSMELPLPRSRSGRELRARRRKVVKIGRIKRSRWRRRQGRGGKRRHEHRRKCPPRRREGVLSPRQPMGRFRRQRKTAEGPDQDRTLQPRLFRPDRPFRPRRGPLHDVRRTGDRGDRWEGVFVLRRINSIRRARNPHPCPSASSIPRIGENTRRSRNGRVPLR